MKPRVFGPFYPPELQNPITHAEKFAEALEHMLANALPEEPVAVWLLGRAAEIETFVADIVHDWQNEGVAVQTAATMISVYLANVHQALASHFGEGFTPACCASDCDDRTSLAWSSLGVTATTPVASTPVADLRRTDLDPTMLDPITELSQVPASTPTPA